MYLGVQHFSNTLIVKNNYNSDINFFIESDVIDISGNLCFLKIQFLSHSIVLHKRKMYESFKNPGERLVIRSDNTIKVSVL